MNNSKNYKKAVLLFIPIALLIVFVMNYRAVKDIVSALSYRPTEASTSVENSLGLTPLGSRIFRASHPSITSDFAPFSDICYQGQSATEVSIKGCYVREHIYVYDITDPELSGITESTSAHELLHAVWARLSSNQRLTLTPILEDFYASASQEFRDTLESYPEEEMIEETYVRSATQVKDLPDALESHFAQYFTDQDAVVDFYDSYSETFLSLQRELDRISARITDLSSQITAENSQLGIDMTALRTDVDTFNSCANTSGCFTDAEFWSQRSALLARQSDISARVDALNVKIADHNRLVEEYNSNILKNRSLETIINPNLENLNIK